MSPIHKAMNTAKLLKNLGSRSQKKMIGVGEKYLRPQFRQNFRALITHDSVCPDRHENRSLHEIVGGTKARSASLRTGCNGIEFELEARQNLNSLLKLNVPAISRHPP